MVDTRVGTGLSFSVLGPLAASRDGRPLDLGAPKQRALLAVLLANPNEPISVGRIITAIWGADASASYRRSVQTYVSNLRAALDTEIPRSGDNYMLAIDPSRIDAVRFEETVDEATTLIATDPGLAAGRLRDALAMWRGRPYTDVGTVEGIQAEITRLEELRLAAVELRIDAELAAGRDRELIAEVEALAAEYPLRERFRAQHMIALYRAGRQSEALRVFEQTRDYLAEELGIEPSQELQDLELAVLQHDRELASGTALTTTQRLAFLATSIDGLDEAWDRNPQVMGDSVWRLHEAISTAVEAHGGRVFHETGEGLGAVFTEVTASVLAAEEAQRKIAAISWGDLEPLAAGVAIDVGEAERSGDRFSGPPVTRVRRLAQKAWGCQILLSSSVQEALASASISGLQIRQLGEFALAGFAKPERVSQLVVEGLSSEFDGLRPSRGGVAPDGSISFSLPGYEIRELVGRGAIGAVYRAYQPSVGREVAIKVIRPTMSNHPRFFSRFETEARVIARLAHPHIVPLIDFWRDAEGAYLVLQYMSGGSLGDALEAGDLQAERAHRIIGQVASALEHAHDRGVAHGDVSPTNVLLDESGNAYLADFDIASRLLDQRTQGGVSIPVDFQAPELADTGPSDAADIYAFGKLIELVVDDPTLEPVIEKATDADVGQRFSSVRSLLEAYEAALDEELFIPARISIRNPYKGLRPFDEVDSEDFHGRDALIAELIDRVGKSRFVDVVGPSGSGKSSAVRAGLLPALAWGAIDGSEDWPTLILTPGNQPIENLLEGLETLTTGPLDLRSLLFNRGLGKTAEILLQDTAAELVLVVDQFEELFSQAEQPQARRQFIDLIVDAVRSDSPVRVVVTVRADFYEHLLDEARINELARDGQVTVLPPTREELIDMITCPGRASGLEFTEGLPAQIAEDVVGRTGGLPLLQYALTEMVENREGNLLSVDDYLRVGGVAGALAGRAEAVFQGLPERLKTLTRRVLLRLVATDDDGRASRRRVRLVELETLGTSRDDVEVIVAPFITERMLLADRDPTTRGPTVEVAHEALLREWPRLSAWIDDEREALVLGQRLRSAHAEWESADRHPDFLLRGSQHHAYQPLLDSDSLTLAEIAFLEESRNRELAEKERRRSRRRAFTAALTATALIGLLLAVVATVQGRRAAEAADLARSRELASSAINVLDRDPELSVLLATEALTLSEPTFESISALHEALYNHRLLWTLRWSGDPAFFTGALSPDAKRLVLGGIGRVEMWDTNSRSLLWQLDLPGEMHVRPFFSTDGAEVIALAGWPRLSPVWGDPPPDAEPGIYRWDAATGDEMASITDLACPVWDIGQYASTIDPSVPLVVAGFAEAAGGCDQSRGTITTLELASGTQTELASIPLGIRYTSSLSTSRDGRFASFVDLDQGRVVDTLTGEIASPLPTAVNSMTLTSDGSSAVVITNWGALGLWDLETGALQTQFAPNVRGRRVSLSPDGTMVYQYEHSGEIQAWNTTTGVPMAHLFGASPPSFNSEMGSAPISVAGEADRVASFAADGSVRVWVTSPIGEVGTIPVGSGLVTARSLTVARDKAALMMYQLGDKSATAFLFEPTGGEMIGTIEDVGAQTVRLSPDARLLASQSIINGEVLGQIQLHELESGGVTKLTGLCDWPVGSENNPPDTCRPYPQVPYQDWARDLVFSADSSLVALAGAISGSVTVWDVASGDFVYTTGPLMRTNELDPAIDAPAIAFHPDTREMAVSTGDELLIYDTDNWEVVRRATMDRMTTLEYTPDGKRLLGTTTSPSLLVVDPDELTISNNLVGHNGRIHGLGVSPDGARVATSDLDGLVTVWEVESGMPLQAIQLGDEIQNVEFIDSDHILVTPKNGPNALVLTLDVSKLMEIAADRVTREFTEEECRIYLHLESCPEDAPQRS